MSSNRFLYLASSVVSLALTQVSALAEPVLTFDGSTGGAGLHSDGTTIGWKFNVLNDVVVNGLGWFDENLDGLANSHHIGIWGPTGVLLADVTVPAGTVASLDGQFRTAAIAPIALPVGSGYIVGGLSSASDSERMACGNPDASSVCYPQLMQSLDSRVQYVSANYSASLPSLSRPTFVGVSSQGYYGPSFSVQAVPEPASLIICLWVIFGAAFLLRDLRAVFRI
jgi:hypothetical protein